MTANKQWGILLCLPFLLTVAPHIATAGNAPTTKELLEAASFDLKRPLKADSITVTATRKQGAAAKLVVKQKFSMQVSFTEDTYKKSGKIGNATVLSVVTKKGTTTTLYGIAESTRDGNNWQPKFKFENKFDYAVWGSPKSAFPGKILLSGSKEEKDYSAQAKAEAARIEARVKGETEKNKAMEAERIALKEKKEKEKALSWEKNFQALTKKIEQGSHEQRVAEIHKAFDTADTKLHKRLMEFLSKHDDVDLRSIAIRMKIDKAGELATLVNNGNPNIAPRSPLTIRGVSIDDGSGKIQFDFTNYRKEYIKLAGTINAKMIDASNNYCHLKAKLFEPNKLKGEISCNPRALTRKVIIFLPE